MSVRTELSEKILHLMVAMLRVRCRFLLLKCLMFVIVLRYFTTNRLLTVVANVCSF